MIHRFPCIGCPLGCRLEVEVRDGEVVAVRGYRCRRGKAFAEQEHVDPRRTVTTTVRVRGGVVARLPVRTRDGFPRDRVRELCVALHAREVAAPVAMGDVVMDDALGTGVAVVASRDVAARADAPAGRPGSANRGPRAA